MNEIRGRCKTNLDSHKSEKWPTFFVAVPRVGEWMASEGGKILTVCKVTHAQDPKSGAFIIVELHNI